MPSPKPSRRFFVGPIPTQCQQCKAPFTTSFVDGTTKKGWMMLCEQCHSRIGQGFGIGIGQRYYLQDDKRWYLQQYGP